MRFLGVNFTRGAELRQVDYTQAITNALQELAEQAPVKASGLAVVETCVSLIAEPFLVARLSGPLTSPRTLYAAARDVLRVGNSVWAISTEGGSLSLQRAHKWKVRGGSANSSTWEYDLEIMAPDGVVKRTLTAPSVVHLRLIGPADSDWNGSAPWQSAHLSSDAMAEIERGIRDESRLTTGRIWLAPDGATQEQAAGMAATVKAMRGGRQVVNETTAQGFGQGKTAAPSRDWTPASVGQSHSAGNVSMRDSVQGSIAAAYGVPAAYMSMSATAPGLREAKRLAFLNKTLPLAALMVEELREKLGGETSITWPNLADQSVDVHLRARGAAALMELVQDKATLLELVGLPMTATATAIVDELP